MELRQALEGNYIFKCLYQKIKSFKNKNKIKLKIQKNNKLRAKSIKIK